MDSRELVAFLAQATLVGSAAIALVLLSRRPLRRAFGAQVAYAAWWLVPAALLASALPSMSSGDLAEFGVRLAAPMRAATSFAGREAGFAWQSWAIGTWAIGAVAFDLLMVAAQARFRATLGALRPHGEAWRAEHAAEGLPATVGVLAPRIVVPADFESRYDAHQRELVLAHERAHIARGDASANLAVAVVRCLGWFNPLVHAAARRFRYDQELACDAIVVARHPRLRRAYGDALFQTQCAAQASPLGCHFGFGHPLRERIAMLKETLPSPARRLAGTALVATFALGTAFAAWAAHPPQVVSQSIVDRGAIRVSLQPPAYPVEAKKQKVGGTVFLLVDVAADGSVAGARVERSEPAGVFDEAALSTVSKWKFNPAMKGGRPVASRVRVPIRFEIKPGAPKAG